MGLPSSSPRKAATGLLCAARSCSVRLRGGGSRRRRVGRRLFHLGVDTLHVGADGDQDSPRHDRDERREQRVLDDVLASFLTHETVEQILHFSLSYPPNWLSCLADPLRPCPACVRL